MRTAIRNLQMTNFYVAILYDFLTFHPASLGALPETTACTARDRGQLKLYCRDLSHLDHPLSLMCTLCPVYTSKILLTTPQPFALDLSFVSRRSIMASHPAAAADDTISAAADCKAGGGDEESEKSASEWLAGFLLVK